MARGERYDRVRRFSRTAASISSKYQNDSESASSLSCVINLLNTIIGTGLLATPHVLSQMGILVGTAVILWSGLTAGFGLYLQARCAQYLDRGTSSFFALSQITYPNASVIFDAAIAIKCFGVGVSYLIIIGDLMPGVINGLFKDVEVIPCLLDRQFWITAFMLVVIPLSFVRRLDSLKYTSILALLSIGYLVLLVLYHFIQKDTTVDRGEIRIVEWAGIVPTLRIFPVIVFAYTCHQNMFSILNEIRNNTHRSTSTVIVSSIGTAAFFYILVAITGYLSFGNEVAGNIVGMYATSIGSTIGKAAIVLLGTFSYPLQVHPCRASIDMVLRWRFNRRETSPNSSDASSSRSVPLLANQNRQIARNETISEPRLALITSIIIILSYTVAMMVSSLDKVLAFVGSTGSTSISFILPGLFYYKISSPNSAHRLRLLKEEDDNLSDSEDENLNTSFLTRSRWKKSIRKLSLALVVYGFIVMGVCLGINIFGGAMH